jgi:hypothetical protein
VAAYTYPIFSPNHMQRLTELYVEAFARRLLPIFADIANEADASARKYEQKLMSRCDPHDLWDPSSIAEQALHHGTDVYEDLYFVKRQLIGLAIAGLFHLWEKLSKEMIDIEVRHVTTKLPSSEKIANWEINYIQRTLNSRGTSYR